MYYITVISLLTIPLIIAVPWSHGEARGYGGLPAEDYNGLNEADNVEQVVERRNWCARWGDSCVPDAKVQFARCCAGMRCDCGSKVFGGNGKCECKKESVFGR